MSAPEEPRMAVINSRTGVDFEAGRGQHHNGEAPLGVETVDAREEHERPRRCAIQQQQMAMEHAPARKKYIARASSVGNDRVTKGRQLLDQTWGRPCNRS